MRGASGAALHQMLDIVEIEEDRRLAAAGFGQELHGRKAMGKDHVAPSSHQCAQGSDARAAQKGPEVGPEAQAGGQRRRMVETPRREIERQQPHADGDAPELAGAEGGLPFSLLPHVVRRDEVHDLDLVPCGGERLYEKPQALKNAMPVAGGVGGRQHGDDETAHEAGLFP
jgi:hypothetical protein